MAKPNVYKDYPTLSLKSYFLILLQPIFLKRIEKTGINIENLSLKSSFVFLYINLFIGSFLPIIGEALAIQRPNLLMIGLGQIILGLPMITLGVWLVSLLLYVMARFLGGAGDLKTNMKAVCLSSGPLMFIGVTEGWWIVHLGLFYALTYNFYILNRYSKTSALINILVPYFLYLLVVWGIF